MTYRERFMRDPAVCAGRPVIWGTRVLVRVVLGYLPRGETTEVRVIRPVVTDV